MATTSSKPLYCDICGKPALFRIEGADTPLCGECASRDVLVRAYADGIARLRAPGGAHTVSSRPVVPGVERAP